MNHFISRLDPGLEGKSYVKDITEVIDKMGDKWDILCCINIKFSEVDNFLVYTVTV